MMGAELGKDEGRAQFCNCLWDMWREIARSQVWS